MENQMKIIQLISSGASVEETLTYLITCLEKHRPFSKTYAAIMLYESFDNKLITVAESSLPNQANRQQVLEKVGPHEGACGTAAFFKKTVFISDMDRKCHGKTC